MLPVADISTSDDRLIYIAVTSILAPIVGGLTKYLDAAIPDSRVSPRGEKYSQLPKRCKITLRVSDLKRTLKKNSPIVLSVPHSSAAAALNLPHPVGVALLTTLLSATFLSLLFIFQE
jgi:hypothetical protein